MGRSTGLWSGLSEGQDSSRRKGMSQASSPHCLKTLRVSSFLGVVAGVSTPHPLTAVLPMVDERQGRPEAAAEVG